MSISCGKENNPGTADSKIPVYKTVSVSEFLALPVSDTYYNIKGTVEAVSDSHYSQFTLKDKTGSVSVYGLWSGEGGSRVYDMDGYKAGDEISIAAQHSEYKGEVEAKNAFIYDPAKIKVWVKDMNLTCPSEASTLTTTMYALGKVSINSEADWLEGSFSEEDEVLTISVKANTELDIRVGYLTVSCDESSQRIRVTQDAYEPQVIGISEALGKDFARVSGVITAMGSKGYVLTDESASIFVKADSFLGLDLGTTMDVSGSISTAGYLTTLVPETSSKVKKGTAKYDKAAAFTLRDAVAKVSELSALDAAKPGTLNLQMVSIKGMLYGLEDGTFRIADFDSDETIVMLDESKSFETSEFLMKYVEIKGHLTTVENGVLSAVAGTIEEVKVESAVTIDGDFSDWAAISGYSQNVTDNPLVESKFYVAGTDIYVYFKAKSEAFTEIGSYKYFAQVYFNTDMDNATGPYAWCFPGLETCAYLYMFNDSGFNTNGSGSILNQFKDGDGCPFISANASLFEGTFVGSGGETFPCGGARDDNFVEFEFVISLSKLDVPRHTEVGAGIRLCHEGPNTPSGSQENFFIPSDGWFNINVK